MSIDEIIKHIDEDAVLSYRGKAAYAWVGLQHIPKIVALLKAGQAMRGPLDEAISALTICGYGPLPRHMTLTIKAWDAATGGEK